MYRLLVIFLFVLVSGSFAKTLVAVVETKADESVLTQQEKFFVTDKLREIANTTLPAYQGYSIMTRENIDVMLPPGKTIEECEGSCLAETGRKIAADFIAQARVGQFGDKLSLTVEMYETRTGKLVSSFTETSYDAESLLDVITEHGGAFFKKIRNGNDGSNGFMGTDGFSDYSDGEAYYGTHTQSYIVQISSNPPGALLSVDGDPVPACKATPCKVQLEAGTHRFSVVADQYFKKDSTIDIHSGKSVVFRLTPRFGTLKISPSYDRIYRHSETQAYLDGEPVELGINRLNPGVYNLRIVNNCYETISTTVTVKTGSELNFDKTMKTAKGGLSLSATRDNEPVEEPVYVDGYQVGNTPYSGNVPVCADITIGDNQENVPVTIPYHDEVSYTYEFASTQSYDWDEDTPATAKTEREENYPTAVRGTHFYSSDENISSASSSASSSNSSLYVQFALGIGLDLLTASTEFDDEGLDLFMFNAYAELFLGWKFNSGIFMGVGAGIGTHFPTAVEDSSANCGSYYSDCMSEDEANDMLPNPSFAVILSAEMGVDISSGYAIGLRGNVMLSAWPTISVNFFAELFSFTGIEIGYASVAGDDDEGLWDKGGAVSMKLYFRLHSRPGIDFSLLSKK